MESTRVLAKYDVRGKQEYIYRSSRIKEIIGGSCMIRDVFEDYLYTAAKQYRNDIDVARDLEFEKDLDAIYKYSPAENEQFDLTLFEQRMNEGQYLGEVIYDGGGNFMILYRDKAACIEVNKRFTKELLINTYTVKVVCTYIEDLNPDDYQGDAARLQDKHAVCEAQESVLHPCNSLPIVQVDSAVSMPLTKLCATSSESRKEKVTQESFKKYEKYRYEVNNSNTMGEKELDRIVTEMGKESLLAVIYIDGNNMGAQVDACLQENRTYVECINALRKFSKSIQTDYVEERISAMNHMLDKKYKNKRRRTIVAAGDEMTIICNARDALDMVDAYFKDLPQKCSSCAGIAVFHSHAPYAEVYRIAEECCESAKRFMKKESITEASLVDFHYCQSGIGVSLDQIRKREAGDICSKPWFLRLEENQKEVYNTIGLARKMAGMLNQIGRSNVKSLLDHAKNSQMDLDMTLERINAHREKPLDFTLQGKLDNEQKRKLIYDVVMLYDLWFTGEE